MTGELLNFFLPSGIRSVLKLDGESRFGFQIFCGYENILYMQSKYDYVG